MESKVSRLRKSVSDVRLSGGISNTSATIALRAERFIVKVVFLRLVSWCSAAGIPKGLSGNSLYSIIPWSAPFLCEPDAHRSPEYFDLL